MCILISMKERRNLMSEKRIILDIPHTCSLFTNPLLSLSMAMSQLWLMHHFYCASKEANYYYIFLEYNHKNGSLHPFLLFLHPNSYTFLPPYVEMPVKLCLNHVLWILVLILKGKLISISNSWLSVNPCVCDRIKANWCYLSIKNNPNYAPPVLCYLFHIH